MGEVEINNALVLDDSVKQQMSNFAKPLHFTKGEILFSSGELSKYFYVVQRGRIKISQLNFNNGKEQTIMILRAGDMFDTITLLDGKPHDVIYETLEETEVIEMPISQVRELMLHNEEFSSKFFPYVAQQMRQLEELSTDLSLYSTEERFIKLLLQNLDPSNSMKYNLLEGLSNTEIAKLLGTVRHVIERHIKKLREDGIIEAKSKALQIKDAKKLLDKINLF